MRRFRRRKGAKEGPQDFLLNQACKTSDQTPPRVALFCQLNRQTGSRHPRACRELRSTRAYRRLSWVWLTQLGRLVPQGSRDNSAPTRITGPRISAKMDINSTHCLQTQFAGAMTRYRDGHGSDKGSREQTLMDVPDDGWTKETMAGLLRSGTYYFVSIV